MAQYVATEKDRFQVLVMASMGIQHKAIARVIGVCVNTLKKNHKEELAIGREKTNSMVASALFKSAMKGNVAAQIFWLKTRAGWHERVSVEHDLKQLPNILFGELGTPGFETVPDSSSSGDEEYMN